jgi:hypothetical protein
MAYINRGENIYCGKRRKLMRKIIGIVAIVLLASGYAAGADYWHFGIGTKVAGVMPGKNYSNALGEGVLLTFGDPDTKFTTQIDFETWGVDFTKSGDYIMTSAITDPDTTYKIRQRRYSGLGLGIFEKYRAIDFSEALSAYLIGGFGGYFLDYKEEISDNGIILMQSKGLHSLGQIAAGLGFEGKLYQRVSGFIEGRFVGFINAKESDKNLVNGYVGMRYVF